MVRSGGDVGHGMPATSGARPAPAACRLGPANSNEPRPGRGSCDGAIRGAARESRRGATDQYGVTSTQLIPFATSV